MNLNDITIGQAREIAAIFAQQATQSSQTPHGFIGRHVICRCSGAGVHAGVLVSKLGDEAILRNSRRLWSWKAKAGVALSGLAVHGLEAGKVDTCMPEIALLGVIEILPTSHAAQVSIEEA